MLLDISISQGPYSKNARTYTKPEVRPLRKGILRFSAARNEDEMNVCMSRRDRACVRKGCLFYSERKLGYGGGASRS